MRLPLSILAVEVGFSSIVGKHNRHKQTNGLGTGNLSEPDIGDKGVWCEDAVLSQLARDPKLGQSP